MDLLMTLVAFSAIIWYIIDRFKPLWDGFTWSKYVTMGLALALSALSVFAFGLDLVFALNLFGAPSLYGQILTIISLMSGSSAVSEIIQKVKGGEDIEHYD